MTTPLIGPNDVMGLLAVAAILIAFCFWLEGAVRRFPIPASTAILALAMLASNIGIIPTGSPTHSMVIALAVPIALPLLLFKANLRVAVLGIGALLVPFVIATLATCIAVLVGFAMIDLGPEEVAFAATNAAGFLGGSVNYVAVSRATELSATGFAIGSAAFVVAFIPYLAILQFIAVQPAFRRHFVQSRVLTDADAAPAPLPDTDAAPQPAATGAGEDGAALPLGLLVAVALAVVIAALSARIGEAIGAPQLNLLIATALSLAVANAAPGPLARLRGEQTLGTWILMVYFVFMGSTAEARVLIEQAGPATWFIAVTITLHLILLLVLGKLARQPLHELLLASNATIGGPPTASAFAQAIGATRLITPAVLAGVLGYATATFVALGLAGILPLLRS